MSVSAARVSVIVPAYNYARYVTEAVDSVLRQSLRDVEVILVDDRSTDDTWEVVQCYAEDPRVTLIRHEKNRGHIATYHTGMARASGHYVVLLSADDRAVDDEALFLQARILDSQPEVGLVSADFLVIDEDGVTLAERRVPTSTRVPGREAFRRLLFENFLQHSGTMVRARCFRELGGYDDRLFHSVDWEMWLRIATHYDLAHVPRTLYAYRMHRRNMHKTHGYDDSIREIEAVLDIAMAYGPFREPRLRERALARHHAVRAGVWARTREYRRALADLAAAWRLDPRAVLHPEPLRGLIAGFARPRG